MRNLMRLFVSVLFLLVLNSCSVLTKKDPLEIENPNYIMPERVSGRIANLESKGYFVVYSEAIEGTKIDALESAEKEAIKKVEQIYVSKINELKKANSGSDIYLSEAIDILAQEKLSGVNIDNAYSVISGVKNVKSSSQYSAKVIGFFDLNRVYHSSIKDIDDELTHAKVKEVFDKLSEMMMPNSVKSVSALVN